MQIDSLDLPNSRPTTSQCPRREPSERTLEARRDTNLDSRHIMNPHRCSLFVPEMGLWVRTADLTFVRPPHRRLWRGCAALLAGGEDRPRSGPRGASRNFPGRFAFSSDIEGMERKTESPAFFTERTLAAYLAVSD